MWKLAWRSEQQSSCWRIAKKAITDKGGHSFYSSVESDATKSATNCVWGAEQYHPVYLSVCPEKDTTKHSFLYQI